MTEEYQGKVYFCDNIPLDGSVAISSGSVREISYATRVLTTILGSSPTSPLPTSFSYANGIGTNARLTLPIGIVLDAVAGALYVADSRVCNIRRINIATKEIEPFLGWEPLVGSNVATVGGSSQNGPVLTATIQCVLQRLFKAP